jgi:hypothetical protein
MAKEKGNDKKRIIERETNVELSTLCEVDINCSIA